MFGDLDGRIWMALLTCTEDIAGAWSFIGSHWMDVGFSERWDEIGFFWACWL
jgi:hypothetical protein